MVSFGGNLNGQLGLGHNENVAIPEEIPSLTNINMISCGFTFSVILNEKQKVYTFGSNERGNLGLGDFINRFEPTLITSIKEKVIQISTGHYHTLLLDIN